MTRIPEFPINARGSATKVPYTVFVDESFDGFLGLANPNGYFCYAALMVPTKRISDLDRFWKGYRVRLGREYEKVTGFVLGRVEFKSGLLNKLDFFVRQDLGQRLAYFLRKNDCFVGAFYTTVDSFALYHLRSDVGFDEKDRELPADWIERLPLVKQRLLERDGNAPGVAQLLSGLLHVTLEITLNWLGSGGFSFEVIYDPREKREDAFLLRHVGSWLSDEHAAFKRYPGVFRGATAKIRSDASPGLMLVDLILRDLRFLFSDLPGLTEESSSTKLIHSTYQDEQPFIMKIKGILLKAGHVRTVSPQLATALAKPTANSMLPLYADRLADMKISCHAAFGELRTIDFRSSCFQDMVD